MRNGGRSMAAWLYGCINRKDAMHWPKPPNLSIVCSPKSILSKGQNMRFGGRKPETGWRHRISSKLAQAKLAGASKLAYTQMAGAI
jgi:hypothetical protein